jgi:hypothetical protein
MATSGGGGVVAGAAVDGTERPGGAGSSGAFSSADRGSGVLLALRFLALALHARLLVVLASASLGEDAGLLDLLVEAAQGAFERLVLTHSDFCQSRFTSSGLVSRLRASCSRPSGSTLPRPFPAHARSRPTGWRSVAEPPNRVKPTACGFRACQHAESLVFRGDAVGCFIGIDETRKTNADKAPKYATNGIAEEVTVFNVAVGPLPRTIRR